MRMLQRLSVHLGGSTRISELSAPRHLSMRTYKDTATPLPSTHTRASGASEVQLYSIRTFDRLTLGNRTRSHPSHRLAVQILKRVMIFSNPTTHTPEKSKPGEVELGSRASPTRTNQNSHTLRPIPNRATCPTQPWLLSHLRHMVSAETSQLGMFEYPLFLLSTASRYFDCGRSI